MLNLVVWIFCSARYVSLVELLWGKNGSKFGLWLERHDQGRYMSHWGIWWQCDVLRWEWYLEIGVSLAQQFLKNCVGDLKCSNYNNIRLLENSYVVLIDGMLHQSPIIRNRHCIKGYMIKLKSSSIFIP